MPAAKPRTPNKTPALVRDTPRSPLEVVDPIWLVKALALSLVAALICVYATLCLLVYQGEWQLVLHPVRTIDRIPASAGLDYTDARFGAAETGQPRLTGWWIPAQSAPPPGSQLSLQTIPKYADYTVLYLHDGSGSLSSTVPALTRPHSDSLRIRPWRVRSRRTRRRASGVARCHPRQSLPRSRFHRCRVAPVAHHPGAAAVRQKLQHHGTHRDP